MRFIALVAVSAPTGICSAAGAVSAGGTSASLLVVSARAMRPLMYTSRSAHPLRSIPSTTMSDWSLLEREWLTVPPPSSYDPFQFAEYESYFEEKITPVPPTQAHYSPPDSTLTVLVSRQVPMTPMPAPPPPPPPPAHTSMPMPVSVPPLVPEQQPMPAAMSLPPPHQMPPAQLLPSLESMQPAHMMPQPQIPSQVLPPPPQTMTASQLMPPPPAPASRGVNPRELRNKAEKLRRDTLNQTIATLASIVPHVATANRKIDKTGVLRLTAHYLRTHQHVFRDSSNKIPEFKSQSVNAVISLLNGCLLTTTYKGLIVVVSSNITEHLGYPELDLLGNSIFKIIHEEDIEIMRQQLMPKTVMLGPNGQLLVPDGEDGSQRVADALASEKRSFFVRFKKMTLRSEPPKYILYHVQGSLRKSDRVSHNLGQYSQMSRRTRARGENPCASGNDVVFVGVMRPVKETFINESALESYRMEYRTRHSIDGEIIQSEQRISLVTGYMPHEVFGVNAMNFIHRNEVRWVIIALQEMYNRNHLYGESCYRLMTKSGEFIYLRTRGLLDVDQHSRVTSFICTNTVVNENDGKHLIQIMKEKFKFAHNTYNDCYPIEHTESQDGQVAPVENPRDLEIQILNLVTNLPSPDVNALNTSYEGGQSPTIRFSIIPPEKEKIVNAIEKIYDVIKTIPKQPSILQEEWLSPSYGQTMSKPTEPYNDTYFCQNDYETEPIFDTGASSTYASNPVVQNYNNIPDMTYRECYYNDAEYQSMFLPFEPLSGANMTGTKRPNYFDNQDPNTLVDYTVQQNNTNMPDMTYQERQNNDADYQRMFSPFEPLSGASMTGTKRPNNFDNQDPNTLVDYTVEQNYTNMPDMTYQERQNNDADYQRMFSPFEPLSGASMTGTKRPNYFDNQDPYTLVDYTVEQNYTNMPDMTYQERQNNDADYQRMFSPFEPLSGASMTGTKRPNNFDNQDPNTLVDYTVEQIYTNMPDMTYQERQNNDADYQRMFSPFEPLSGASMTGTKRPNYFDNQDPYTLVDYTVEQNYTNMPDMTYQERQNNDADYQRMFSPFEPLSGASMTGTKRPNNFDTQDTITKKKVMEAVEEPKPDTSASERCSPSVDKLLNDTLQSQDIESALNSLYDPADPNFPEVPISQELIEFMENID